MTDHVKRLLEHLPEPDARHFLALVESFYQARFTGATTLHWINGVPKYLDVGHPIRLPIVPPLDNGGASAPKS